MSAIIPETPVIDMNGTDPSMPQELVPQNGGVTREQVQYQTVHILNYDLTQDRPESSSASADRTDSDGDERQNERADGASNRTAERRIERGVRMPFDLQDTALMEHGFSKPATGVMLTSEQTWLSYGVTLGQLLYTVALAPGEVTRVAIDDWTRTTRGERDEDVDQTTAIQSQTSGQRALSDVTNSVMHQTQYGSSRAQSQSASDQSGDSVSGSYGTPFASFNAASTHNQASNRSLATNVSRSSSTRNLSSSTNQKINSTTHQHASEARNRRSGVVQETREGEGERLTTRVVTNYNHMHAMSVEYYEVIQNYQVVTRTSHYERCLFVPLQPFDFRDPRVVLRYREILEKYALKESIKEALHAANATNWRTGHTVSILADGLEVHSVEMQEPMLKQVDYTVSSGDIWAIWVNYAEGNNPFAHQTNNHGSLTFSPIPLSKITHIGMDPDYVDAGSELTLTLHFQSGNGSQTDTFAHTVTIPHYFSYAYDHYRPISFKVSKTEDEAIAHLQQYGLYYSQAIWANMPETDWMEAMEEFTYQGDPVGTMIDPTPIAMMGNYMGFRWHFPTEEEKLDWLLETGMLNRDFADWLQENGHQGSEVTEEIKQAYLDDMDEPQGDEGIHETLMPMPTGGIFAEAVLGRFNCAEKIDLTRFWNWKDSPIPILPPAINPMTAGQRGAPELLSNLKASGFDPDQIHLHMTPPVASKAAVASGGNAAALKALTTAGVFRDMSNGAATAALAGQGLQQAREGASAAGQQSIDAMRISSEQQQANLQTMANLAEQVLPLLLAPETGGLSLMGEGASGAGGLMNAAKDLDEAGGVEQTSHQSGLLSSLGKMVGGLLSGGDTKSNNKAENEADSESTA